MSNKDSICNNIVSTFKSFIYILFNNIVIYSIGVGDSVDVSILSAVAYNSGGAYYHASYADEIANAFYEIQEETVDLVTDTMTKDSKRIVLYFADKNGDCLITENRTIKITDTNPVEQYVVIELIKGPLSSDAKSILSQDTELISAQTTDNVCFVNFKSGFIEKNTGN